MRFFKAFLLLFLLSLCRTHLRLNAQALPQNASSATARLLKGDEVVAVMPPAVFFRSKTAPVQTRNSGGLRLSGGGLVLVGLVDTSGYASDVQERYQAYLLLDEAITVEGKRLNPGAYGVGFVKGDQFVVMDIGGHDVFVTASHRDNALRRPTPLQMLTSPEAGRFRLYVGKSFVTVAPDTPGE